MEDLKQEIEYWKDEATKEKIKREEAEEELQNLKDEIKRLL